MAVYGFWSRTYSFSCLWTCQDDDLQPSPLQCHLAFLLVVDATPGRVTHSHVHGYMSGLTLSFLRFVCLLPLALLPRPRRNPGCLLLKDKRTRAVA